MSRAETPRNHGDEVVVLDAGGNYLLRGRIVGVNRCDQSHYDVRPNQSESLTKRMCGIPASRLKSVGKAILAYEGRCQPDPAHILDDA